MFSLVGFDCKGQVIPTASLPSPIDYECLEIAMCNQIWPFPSPKPPTIYHCPTVTEPSLPKDGATGTRRGTHQGRGRKRPAQVTTVESGSAGNQGLALCCGARRPLGTHLLFPAPPA